MPDVDQDGSAVAKLRRLSSTIADELDAVTGHARTNVERVAQLAEQARLTRSQMTLGREIRQIGTEMVAVTDAALGSLAASVTTKADELGALLGRWARILNPHRVGATVVDANLGEASSAPPAPPDDRLTSIDGLHDLIAVPMPGRTLRGWSSTVTVAQSSIGTVALKQPRADASARRIRPTMRVAVWDEADLLRRMRPYLSAIPEVLYANGPYQIQRWIDHQRTPSNTPWDPEKIGSTIAEFARVPLEALPPLPTNWPDHGDSTAYATMLLERLEASFAPYREAYGDYYAALGVPLDPATDLRHRFEDLTSRPFSVVHFDLHRGNILHTPKPVVIDWEYAHVGDPLLDLALHLQKAAFTGLYQPSEVHVLVQEWARPVGPERSRGIDTDLATYQQLVSLQHLYQLPSNRLETVAEACRESPAAVDVVVQREATRLMPSLNAIDGPLWDISPVEEAFVADVLRTFGQRLAQDPFGPLAP